MEQAPQLVALVGGSGAGKTWLSRRLQRALGSLASRLTLDDFHLDHSGARRSPRTLCTLEHPRSIDWPALTAVLRCCREGRAANVPQFSVATRTRLPETRCFIPGPLVLVDGVLLLLRREVRELFDFSVYLDCPASLRLERRLARDLGVTGPETARRHFWSELVPLHERYVAPQRGWADIVMQQPPMDEEVENLAATLRALVAWESPFSTTPWDAAWPEARQRI